MGTCQSTTTHTHRWFQTMETQSYFFAYEEEEDLVMWETGVRAEPKKTTLLFLRWGEREEGARFSLISGPFSPPIVPPPVTLTHVKKAFRKRKYHSTTLFPPKYRFILNTLFFLESTTNFELELRVPQHTMQGSQNTPPSLLLLLLYSTATRVGP